MADKKNLMQRPGRQAWYAVVEVPRDLQSDLGRRKMKSLETPDLKEAQRRRGPVVSELWAQIERERRQLGHSTTERDKVLTEARQVAQERRQSNDPDHLGVITFAIEQRAEEIRRVHDPDLASKYTAVANDALTPLTDKVDEWLDEAAITGKTKQEYRGAVMEFLRWNGGEAFSERVTRRLAGDYVRGHLLKRGLQPAAINRKVSALSTFWQWLERRGLAGDNAWAGQSVPKTKDQRASSKQDQSERAFTDSEVATLLSNAPDQTMYDYLRVLFLSGMRREEAAQLRVGDVCNGLFHIRDGKTTNAIRAVPIHSDLTDIVERRTTGKDTDDFVFHELRDSSRGRSDAIGKKFTRFRRDVNVTAEGKGRRGAVNLHSTRRWFVTKAEQAGHPLERIAPVVGHAQMRPSVTGGYSSGPTLEQYAEIVEAVKLPDYVEPT